MKKIFQSSDGYVKWIETLRMLDEVFAYFRARSGAGMRCFSMLLEYDDQGAVTFRLNGSDVWCRVYPENHPEAPELTPVWTGFDRKEATN